MDVPCSGTHVNPNSGQAGLCAAGGQAGNRDTGIGSLLRGWTATSRNSASSGRSECSVTSCAFIGLGRAARADTRSSPPSLLLAVVSATAAEFIRHSIGRSPEILQPPTSTPNPSDAGTAKAPNGNRCAFEIHRSNRPTANNSG